MNNKPRLSVSTWSLHRTLGNPPNYGPGDEALRSEFSTPTGSLALLDLPAKLAEFGIHTLEICHFHLPGRDGSYLAQLRAALADAGVELFSLLIDSGDVTDSVHGARDLAWIQGWLDVAGELGASNARVIAGKSAASPQTLASSKRGLAALADCADERGVRLMTENWLALTATPESVHDILSALNGRVGLCADFGNWSGPGKYDALASILPYAESCHAKADFSDDDDIDRNDFDHCLRLAATADFSGPFTLIYDGPDDDEWRGLDRERAVVAPYLD